MRWDFHRSLYCVKCKCALKARVEKWAAASDLWGWLSLDISYTLGSRARNPTHSIDWSSKYMYSKACSHIPFITMSYLFYNNVYHMLNTFSVPESEIGLHEHSLRLFWPQSWTNSLFSHFTENEIKDQRVYVACPRDKHLGRAVPESNSCGQAPRLTVQTGECVGREVLQYNWKW